MQIPQNNLTCIFAHGRTDSSSNQLELNVKLKRGLQDPHY